MKTQQKRHISWARIIIISLIIAALSIGVVPSLMSVQHNQALALTSKHKKAKSKRAHIRKRSSRRIKRHKKRKTIVSSTIKWPAAGEISRGPSTSKKIALTFDAGASSEPTPKILKTLKDEKVKATFFLTGKWVEANPALTRQIVAEGHLLGNHTFSHPHLTQETDTVVLRQINSTEDLIKKLTGKSTKPLFRFPYGDRDARTLSLVNKDGYKSIFWTVDSLDWKTDMTPDQVKERILSKLSNGAIVLEHCGSPQTAAVLPDVIKEIKRRGYKIVTVPELFE